MKKIINLALLLCVCCMPALAQEQHDVVVATFRATDITTQNAITSALNSAKINSVLVGSFGTSVDVAPEDAKAARLVLQKLIDSGHASFTLVEDKKK